MSTNLETAKSSSKDVSDVKVTSFSGGKVYGQMIQLHSGCGMDANVIQMTHNQVRDLRNTLNNWLEK